MLQAARNRLLGTSVDHLLASQAAVLKHFVKHPMIPVSTLLPSSGYTINSVDSGVPPPSGAPTRTIVLAHGLGSGLGFWYVVLARLRDALPGWAHLTRRQHRRIDPPVLKSHPHLDTHEESHAFTVLLGSPTTTRCSGRTGASTTASSASTGSASARRVAQTAGHHDTDGGRPRTGLPSAAPPLM